MGRLKESPFAEDVIEDVRDNLHSIRKESGHGDGLPQKGDIVQAYEVRLIQALLFAFADPDWYFCDWWAKGVWLGAPDRKLPRTPAVFVRKVKWKKLEKTDELHGGWQHNYSSIGEHAHLVEKQFEAEEAEGLMGLHST